MTAFSFYHSTVSQNIKHNPPRKSLYIVWFEI